MQTEFSCVVSMFHGLGHTVYSYSDGQEAEVQRNDITLSSPVGPWEDRRGKRDQNETKTTEA